MILVNGTNTSQISIFDRGLAYGDGLFETLAVEHGEILNWATHTARLESGCDRLDISRPDIDQLFAEVLIVTAGFDRSVVKVTITRGPGGSGYSPPAKPAPNRIVARRSLPADYTDREKSGIRVCVAEHRLSMNTKLAGLKHLNRLDQVLASAEMVERGVQEALMRDIDNHIVEATRCNLFVVSGNKLITPSLESCGVRGVMRTIIMQLARAADLVPAESKLTLDDVQDAEEVFLCNAIAGIWPVVEIEHGTARAFPVGKYTRRLQAALVAGNHHR